MCFATKKLKFPDVTHYLTPGVSYDKYLKAYGCGLRKGNFPYKYMDDVRKLDDCVLPPQTAFYSRLKNEGISDEDYARCQAVWHDNRMTTMRDFLVWYNNRDVVPFLEAIDKQFVFYQQQHIDMFKDGISIPGLTLLYLFNDLPPNTYFTVLNRTNSDLQELVKDNIVGGPAIIFHRYLEMGSPRYGVVGSCVARSWDTTIMLNTCGQSCRTCPPVGGRVVGRRTDSVRNRHSRTDRWPSSGSRANRSERVSASIIIYSKQFLLNKYESNCQIINCYICNWCGIFNLHTDVYIHAQTLCFIVFIIYVLIKMRCFFSNFVYIYNNVY